MSLHDDLEVLVFPPAESREVLDAEAADNEQADDLAGAFEVGPAFVVDHDVTTESV